MRLLLLHSAALAVELFEVNMLTFACVYMCVCAYVYMCWVDGGILRVTDI